ncbi:MAG TPA: SRPBCC family protein [Solirubrobacterales bacterium]|nr:SRPBCC family protein [Solirubrobacterales bacterium]
MAVNETHIDAPPEAVFAVLSDPNAYGYWVAGSSEIRDPDDEWPDQGTRFGHKVGWGPLKVSDYTRVEEVDPPHRIKLRAKARPLGTALVTLDIRADGDGSRVRMREDPADALTAFIFNPLTHLLVRGRNAESLDRLRELAQRQAEAPGRAAEERRRFASGEHG